MARVRDAGGGRYVVSARLDDPGESAVAVVLEFARAPFGALPRGGRTGRFTHHPPAAHNTAQGSPVAPTLTLIRPPL